MSPSWTAAQLAEGKIRLAVKRLAEKYIFHVRILEQFRLLPSGSIPTMGVMVAGERVALLFNPGFVDQLPLKQLLGVLLHEAHHVLFGHIHSDPKDFPDHWAWTVAMEVTVNEFVKEPLPRGVIRRRQYPQLPPMESTDERYARLKTLTNRLPLQMPNSAGQHEAASSDAMGLPVTSEKKSSKNSRTAGGPKGSSRIGTIVDVHSIWPKNDGELAAAAAAVKGIIEEAILASAGDIPPDIKRALSKCYGNLPGFKVDQIGATQGRLNWSQLLRRYIGKILQIEPDFRRPPRRFPNMVGVLPGRRRRRGSRPCVMAVIDTSGSLTLELLEQINGEMKRLATDYQILVVECDAAIHRVYPYKPIRDIVGGGGTDFRPPLDSAFLGLHRPDLIVYFTDGFGPAPTKAPPVPLVWCLTAEGEAPSTYGHVIHMSGTEEEK
jgi:predicted metal-dependent peptidase